MFSNFKQYLGKIKRDAKLYKHHLKNSSFKKSKEKEIIICFNGIIPHGGLVDRLKGIISFYDIANLLGYKFYIHFDTPFDLNTFLSENTVNWNIKRADVIYRIGDTKLINCINNFNFNPLEAIRKTSKNTILVYANIDYLTVNNKDMFVNEHYMLWRNHFNTLFTKSQLLKDELNKLPENTYSSIHTRFTTLMGDFVDSTSLVLSKKEQEKLLENLEQKIKKIVEKSNKKIYAFSDSTIFLNEISNRLQLYTLKGNPFHMDNYNGGSTLEAHLKTMIDFFTISNGKQVYFIKVGKMYHSAFSKYAAIIGDKPFIVIQD